MPQYRNKTTLIFSPDHGRGDAPFGWRHHGKRVIGSDKIWMAFMDPDTRALGERAQIAPVTQSQIASILAAFLSQDDCRAVPKAGKPIPDALTHQ
jgi:hypothetical protein